VRPGTALAGAGTLADVTEHVVAGRAVAFLGVLDDGRDVLGWWRDGRAQAAAVDGDRIGRRTLDLSSPLYAAGESTALVEGSVLDEGGGGVPNETSLVLVRRGGRATVVRHPAKSRFSTFFENVVVVGRRFLLLNYEALFTIRDGRLAPVLVPGGDGSGALESISDVAAAGTRVVLLGTQNGVDSLFELEQGVASRFAVLPSSVFLFGIDATAVALSVRMSRDGGVTFVEELQLVGRNGVAGTVAAIGDPSPVGSIVATYAVALAEREVLISARVAGDGARHALLAVDR
jgi:hypothetical protein